MLERVGLGHCVGECQRLGVSQRQRQLPAQGPADINRSRRAAGEDPRKQIHRLEAVFH